MDPILWLASGQPQATLPFQEDLMQPEPLSGRSAEPLFPVQAVGFFHACFPPFESLTIHLWRIRDSWFSFGLALRHN